MGVDLCMNSALHVCAVLHEYYVQFDQQLSAAVPPRTGTRGAANFDGVEQYDLPFRPDPFKR
jgi:hypothetical protein